MKHQLWLISPWVSLNSLRFRRRVRRCYPDQILDVLFYPFFTLMKMGMVSVMQNVPSKHVSHPTGMQTTPMMANLHALQMTPMRTMCGSGPQTYYDRMKMS